MTIPIANDDDIVLARQSARQVAKELGFGMVDQARIATAVSELTRNIVRYATDGRGRVEIRDVSPEPGKPGIEIVVSDDGPGIGDLDRVMQEGFTSGSGLGMGLPGTKRLMDEMEIDSGTGARDDHHHSPLATMTATERFAISGRIDVERVRRAARTLAVAQGFDSSETEELCLAVIELATNLAQYSSHGEIVLRPVEDKAGAIQVESIDQGPGISDVELAMRDGSSSRHTYGDGLGGVRRLMNEFSIESGPTGTRIVARKWPTSRS